MADHVVARTPGIAVPTVAMVTAGHLLGQAGAGEAVDRVASGRWFTARFTAPPAGGASRPASC